MIHAAIYQDERKECVGFSLRGHAGYAGSGQDIVCAAVSVLVINTINSLERFTEDCFSLDSDEESGTVICKFSERPSHDAKLLLDTMILGLSDMADDGNYDEYIDLTFEEV